MAKDCPYGTEVSNGAKAFVTTFIIGAGASLLKRLGKSRKRTAAKKKKE